MERESGEKRPASKERMGQKQSVRECKPHLTQKQASIADVPPMWTVVDKRDGLDLGSEHLPKLEWLFECFRYDAFSYYFRETCSVQ